ncbi:plasmid pRiA4b ORF-3 family protein [Haloflavibacter putidus]|uniref:Plasmid pRiA4b ORF-3 family protein n=1 Tax=Haloflavibacter putidus TaxID=2576776 RepID=A0A507ZUC8_9FLAO|nr:plasmid pRiA4b ORF-3 family protein [Haloflavibacter putidus]TQD40093.1 plasmid pRiA4b ORF-3 family protein [Haloflavibacter putidus]
MVYRFRIVLDTLDEVFRDIEIEDTATLEDLHNATTQAFGFDGTEMASFYLSDEDWNQGEEIVLFDMNEGANPVRMMNETALDTVVSESQTKLIYVYDFFDMWTFYVELADIAEPKDGRDYPNLMYSHGHLPDSPPEKKFEAEKLDDFEDDFKEDFDDNIDFDSLDDFDQNWN